jgi:hypothetical protein
MTPAGLQTARTRRETENVPTNLTQAGSSAKCRSVGEWNITPLIAQMTTNSKGPLVFSHSWNQSWIKAHHWKSPPYSSLSFLKKKKKKQQQKKTTTTSFSRVIFIKFLGLYFTSLQALEPWQSSFHLLALPSASCVFSSLWEKEDHANWVQILVEIPKKIIQWVGFCYFRSRQ